MEKKRICPIRLLAWEIRKDEWGLVENAPKPVCLEENCAWHSTNGCVFLGIEALLGELANDVGCIRFDMEKKGG